MSGKCNLLKTYTCLCRRLYASNFRVRKPVCVLNCDTFHGRAVSNRRHTPDQCSEVSTEVALDLSRDCRFLKD